MLEEQIVRRCGAAGVDLPAALTLALTEYVQLLRFWSRKVNLVGFPLEPAVGDDAVDRLIVEPLVVCAEMPEGLHTLIDIGSGGGSPGLLMPLALPVRRTLLVEAKAKKGTFLREAARHLGIAARVDVRTARYEQVLAAGDAGEPFDLLTSRAVRLTDSEIDRLAVLIRSGGLICLFRGSNGSAPHGSMAVQNEIPLRTSAGGVAVLLEKPFESVPRGT